MSLPDTMNTAKMNQMKAVQSNSRIKIFWTVLTLCVLFPYFGWSQRYGLSSAQVYYIAKNPSPYESMKMFVADSVRQWQKKERFETTLAYKARVTEQSRQELSDRLSNIAVENYLATYQRETVQNLSAQLNDYDADNQTWLISTSLFGQLVLPVPLSEAQQFEQSWSFNQSLTELYLDGETVRLKKAAFESNGKTYWFDNSRQATYATANVQIAFDPINIDVPSFYEDNSVGQIITQRDVKIGTQKSDVDLNIPTTDFVNDKTFVIIITNEKYQQEASVSFANSDGRLFKEYCMKTLGIPEKHIRLRENATLNNMKYDINWLSDVLNSHKGTAKAIFYYSGHGIPDESNGNAYILPVDGYGSDPTTGYSLDDLYNKLGQVPAQSITYFIDACFSGAKREGGMIVATKGVAVKVRKSIVQGNSIVFSAATGDETAYTYNEKGHGMFTYFLLKKLQQTNGNVGYAELADYITDEVQKTSLIENSKKQTPTVVPSNDIGDNWKTWKLK